MRYIIKNCDNCYCYDDEENIKDMYWCEFERDNTHFADPCYKSDCLLKQIVDKLNTFWCDMVGKDYNEEERQVYINQKIADILDLFEIEECEDE